MRPNLKLPITAFEAFDKSFKLESSKSRDYATRLHELEKKVKIKFRRTFEAGGYGDSVDREFCEYLFGELISNSMMLRWKLIDFLISGEIKGKKAISLSTEIARTVYQVSRETMERFDEEGFLSFEAGGLVKCERNTTKLQTRVEQVVYPSIKLARPLVGAYDKFVEIGLEGHFHGGVSNREDRNKLN